MTTATSSLDLVLQSGLEIDGEGRCTRHPEVIVCSKEKGKISACQICAAEQGQMQDESLRSHQLGDPPSRQSQESELGLSISKMVTSISTNSSVPGIVSTIQKRGGANRTKTIVCPPREVEEEDEGSMENLIARWCQLQDSSSKPSSEMLSSTLIMLQLQKLERRVQHQETSIQNLSQTLVQQQNNIQSDLTRILSYVAVTASHVRNSQLVVPSLRDASYHTAGGGVNATASAISALSNGTESTHTHYSRNPTQPPPSSGQQTPVSTSRDSDSYRHTSLLLSGVRTLERQPPKPPKRHDSVHSLGVSGRSGGGVGSVDLSSSPSAHGGTPVSEQPTSVLSPSMITDPRVTLGRSKSKSSFRHSVPQLDIIWDASDHTAGQHSPHKGNDKATGMVGKGTNMRFKNAGKRLPPALATSLDDDDDDDDDRSTKLFSGMKSYIELSKTSDPLNASGLPPLMNHDSCLSGVMSFMEETVDGQDYNDSRMSIQDTIQESPPATIQESTRLETQDEVSTENSSSKSFGKDVDQKKEKEKKKKDKVSKKEKKKKKKEKKDKAKTDGRASIINNKISPSEGKEHRKKGRFSTSKVFWKRSSKTASKGITEGSPNLSPTQDIQRQRISQVSSKHNSPTMPQRQVSNLQNSIHQSAEFSVFNDNPRTHLMPTSSTINMGGAPFSPPSTTKSPVLGARKQAEQSNANSQAAATNTTADAEETMTVKTLLTAKTSMTAKTPSDAIQKNTGYMEPPPPPGQGKRYPRHDLRPPSLQSGHSHAPIDKPPNDLHPASPPPRRRAPFPRSQGMMPTLDSKREILITGESSRMQVSTLTLDTALPSADAGAVLQEVVYQAITDKCKERGTFSGTVNENEEPDGYGTMIYNSGAFYKGSWREGHWHGKGILRTPNGDSYEGDFVYDCRHGRGIYKYENGDVYEGHFSSDKRHGNGTFLFQNGSMFRGDFAYGNFHGHGWYEFDEGYYEGSWVDGLYEGIGSLIYKDGSHYTGRFKAGAADGMGEEKRKDGTSRRGMWKAGEFIGQVEQVHPDHPPNTNDVVLSA